MSSTDTLNGPVDSEYEVVPSTSQRATLGNSNALTDPPCDAEKKPSLKRSRSSALKVDEDDDHDEDDEEEVQGNRSEFSHFLLTIVCLNERLGEV